MTNTPESWDDVGCLRLQVHCISNKVGLNDSEIEKLRHEVALLKAQEQEQKKQRFQSKVCSVITALLFSGVLALQIFMIYNGSAYRTAHSILDEAWKSHLDDFEEVPATQLNEDEQRKYQQLRQKAMGGVIAKQKMKKELLAELQHSDNENAEEQIEKIIIPEKVVTSMREHAEESQKAAEKKPSISLKIAGSGEPSRKQSPELEVQSAQHPQSSVDAEGHVKSALSSIDTREDVKHAEGKDPDQGENHEGGEQAREPAKDKKGLTPPIGDVQPLIDSLQTKTNAIGADSTVTEDPTEREEMAELKTELEKSKAFREKENEDFEAAGDEMGTAIALPSLPFQQSSHGVFYVCFPSSTLEKSVKKYAALFNKVARSQKFKVYPICYIDTRTNLNEIYDEHFCDDVTVTTFVLELSRSSVTSKTKHKSTEIPTQSSFEDCLDVWSRSQEWFSIESPVWFRRVLPPDQKNLASSIDKFLNDVYSGRVSEVKPFKRDL